MSLKNLPVKKRFLYLNNALEISWNRKILIPCFLFAAIFCFHLSAEEKINFDLHWKFIQKEVQGAESISFSDKNWRTVNLPHDWSIEGTYREKENGTDWQGGYLPAGIGWYRKTFDGKPKWANKKIQILFDGVYLNSDVWINGHFLGHRPNGYISFYYDLTPYLKAKNNVLAVRVDHTKPQTGRWYTGSGIYRSVSLLISEKSYIEPFGVYFTTPSANKEQAEIQIGIDYQNASQLPVVVSAALTDLSGKQVAYAEQNVVSDLQKENTVSLKTRVDKPRLWSVDVPNVYRLVCTLKIDGKIADQTTRIVGIRKLTFSDTTGFMLNDVPLKLKGVCDHHTAGCVGAAVPDDVLHRRLRLLKDMGCNAIRTAHNPFSPTFYTMCDTMGIMVLNEAFDGWEKPKAKDDYGNFFNEWWKRDLTDFIKRDRNHPSVILWSIGNEVSNATPETQKKLVDLCHLLDPTRPVTQGGTDPTRGMNVDYAKNFQYLDIVGFNGNGEEVGELERFDKMRQNRCAIGTEVPHTYQTRGTYHTKTTWRRRDFPAPWERNAKISWDNFKTRVFDIPDLSETEVFKDDSTRLYYQSSYDNASVRISARESWRRTLSFPFFMGAFRWGSFDYLGEAEWPQRLGNFGIIDVCGFPKDHYYLYQSLWTDKPMVHLLPHWTHPGKEGVKIPVVIYTNCQEAELFFNQRSLGRKEYQGEQLVWQVPYEPGELKAVSYNNHQKVAEETSFTATEPSTLNLKPDKKIVRADQKEVIHVEIEVVDQCGHCCPAASNLVQVEVSGPVKILAMDNGDPIDLSKYQTDSKKAFRGKCLLLLQSTDKPGQIELKVKSPGLKESTLSFVSK